MTPKPPYAKTYLPGGPERIIAICEALRERNSDGYVPHCGGILANIKQHGSLPVCHGTTCTPFTATVIGVAFDKGYPRDDAKDPYVPKFNGGDDEMMPYSVFHTKHNVNDMAVATIVEYNLGEKIDEKKMRRGDMLEITWNPGGGGHGVFCWDVHLNANKEVDCFQILGSNGPNGGVSIDGCACPPWLTGPDGKSKGNNAKLESFQKEVEVEEYDKVEKKKVKVKKMKTFWKIKTPGDYQKGINPIFADSRDIVKNGRWFGMPGVALKDIDKSTFLVEPVWIHASVAKDFSVRKVRVARFHYHEPEPLPYCMAKGGAAPMKPAPVGHVTAPPPVVVKKVELRKDPDTPKKIEAKPVAQDAEKPMSWQLHVELALQEFYQRKWIQSDPGKPDAINDDDSKKAIKEYQDKFKLKVDGLVGKQTMGSVDKQLPFCFKQLDSQKMLQILFKAKQIENDPGDADGTNHEKTAAAVEEFQNANKLTPTKVPDADTYPKLLEAVKAAAATTTKVGPAPEVQHLYWMGNNVAPGGTATLRITSRDLMIGHEGVVRLRPEGSDKEVEPDIKIKVTATQLDIPIPIPKDFGSGSSVHARAVVDIADGGTLEAHTHAPLQVRSKGGGPELEHVDWRGHIADGVLSDDILEKVRRNRAKYPLKELPASRGGPPKSPHAYEGKNKYDYKPEKPHQRWATAYFEKKRDAATGTDKYALIAYLTMLIHEGFPASLQTYDGLIVTWGVGLGGMGNGVHTFENLNKDPAMKQRLDDLGINYFNVDYHVVDLNQKKLVRSSQEGKKSDDFRHRAPLESWRQQTDLLSAVIGLSEDPATREAVAEAMFAVYMNSTAQWPGKDKVFTRALYFMITHLRAWVPAAGKGIHIDNHFAKYAGGTPSAETDAKIAQPILREFIRGMKAIYLDKRKQPETWQNLRAVAKDHVWRDLRKEGKPEGLILGEFEYEEGY